MDFLKLTLCLLLSGMAVKAQTFAEWFDQQNMQKKYLLQQIAALNAYQSVLKTGYYLAHNGLGSISGSTGSEFSLHQGYFNHLKMVSSVVKNDPQVKDILTWQHDIITILKTLGNALYYQQVKTAVLADCDQQLAELQKVMYDGTIQMSDADRIEAIGKVHTAMLSNYRFSVIFSNQAKALQIHQAHEKNDGNTLKQYYGKP
jgi:hypothetical protein